jgi:hypothetical protein
MNLVLTLPELGQLPDSNAANGLECHKGFQVDPNGATDQSRMLRPNLSFVKVESRRTTVATNFVAHLLRRRLAAALRKTKAFQCNSPIDGGVLSKRNEIKVVQVCQDSLLYSFPAPP